MTFRRRGTNSTIGHLLQHCAKTQIGGKNYPNVVQAPFPNFLPLFPRGIPRNLGRVVEWQVKTQCGRVTEGVGG